MSGDGRRGDVKKKNDTDSICGFSDELVTRQDADATASTLSDYVVCNMMEGERISVRERDGSRYIIITTHYICIREYVII